MRYEGYLDKYFYCNFILLCLFDFVFDFVFVFFIIDQPTKNFPQHTHFLLYVFFYSPLFLVLFFSLYVLLRTLSLSCLHLFMNDFVINSYHNYL